MMLAFSILIIWPLFPRGLFFHHDDLQVMRIYEMRQCFADFQIPCRWVPDMGYGNGFPLFNYYSAFPYYIGAVLSYVMGYINSTKALFFIPLVLGGVSMFLLAQKLFGKQAGFLAGMLYLYAPYRALDSYVRGAIAESFALAIIPLVFYFFLNIIEKPDRKNLVWGSLSLSAFLLSHNIMTMLFMPFFGVWILIHLYLQRWQSWKPVLISFILGSALSAFFLVPIFLETNLVQADTLTSGGSNFRTHFVGVGQLFLDRSWGYGGSIFGPGDTISFQVGWPLWWFAALAVPVLLFTLKKNLKISLVGIFLLIMFAVSVFMQHNQSAVIWEAINPLRFTQFPWRFLSLSIFSGALLGGFVFHHFNFRFKNIILWASIISIVFLNWSYFQPREFYTWINDQNKLEDPLWEIQQKAGILDYLPIDSEEPQGRAPDNIEVISGSATGTNYIPRSNKFSVDIDVETNSEIQIPIFDFPFWTVYSNGNLIKHNNDNIWGRIAFNLPPGTYRITGVLKNTWARVLGNTITLIAAASLMLIALNKRISKKIT